MRGTVSEEPFLWFYGWMRRVAVAWSLRYSIRLSSSSGWPGSWGRIRKSTSSWSRMRRLGYGKLGSAPSKDKTSLIIEHLHRGLCRNIMHPFRPPLPRTACIMLGIEVVYLRTPSRLLPPSVGSFPSSWDSDHVSNVVAIPSLLPRGEDVS